MIFMINTMLQALINVRFILRGKRSRGGVNGLYGVNIITSWGVRCGISDYSFFLLKELNKLPHEKIKLFITSITQPHIKTPLSYFVLGLKSGKTCPVNHLQFEYGLFDKRIDRFSLYYLNALSFYMGLFLTCDYIIATIHEIAPISNGRFLRRNITLLTNRLIYETSKKILVHTRSNRALLIERYRVNSSKILIMPHGSYEHPIFLNKEACKKTLNLVGKKIISIFGFISEHKGHDLVIKILPFLSSEYHLLIAGSPRVQSDEAYYRLLKKMTYDLNVENRVHFIDYVAEQDFPIVLNASDLAILPYRSVTQSGILHILMAYRLPTIASNLDAFEEINAQYHCLSLFANNDPKDLYAKINALSSLQVEVLSAGCLAFWNATKWSVIAKKHLSIYETIQQA